MSYVLGSDSPAFPVISIQCVGYSTAKADTVHIITVSSSTGRTDVNDKRIFNPAFVQLMFCGVENMESSVIYWWFSALKWRPRHPTRGLVVQNVGVFCLCVSTVRGFILVVKTQSAS